MMYCGIIWATVIGILVLWGMGRRLFHTSNQDPDPLAFVLEGQKTTEGSRLRRYQNTIASFGRQYFLPDCIQPIFGRTTRLQVLILVALTGYIAVWSFVGIVYKSWITPVKGMPGVHNTRVGLGPWADRVGVLAYTLTPLSVLLSSRESILSLVTGVPYQHFNFLHRWLGYIIFLQAALHTIGWCVVEMRLYQPQPETGLEWIKQRYMIWGVVAMLFITVMFVLSLPWAIRRTGYEFFRKSHYVLAMLFIGACWGHWDKLDCYLISSLVVWFIDRGVRLVRTGLLHYTHLPSGGMGFRSANATMTYFPDGNNGDVVRLDFTHPQAPWTVGQHFYLTFPELSIWQAHPFTPGNVPDGQPKGQSHAYIVRAKKGATRALAKLASTKKSSSVNTEHTPDATALRASTSVIVTGPYGESIMSHLSPDTNVLCVAGGSGVTFVLPVLLSLVTGPASRFDRRIEFIWAIRRNQDRLWISPELESLRRATVDHNLKIRIFVTREAEVHDKDEGIGEADGSQPQMIEETVEETSTSPHPSDDSKLAPTSVTESSSPGSISIHHPASAAAASPETRHPDLDALLCEFVDSTVCGSTAVYASGPGGMISDLRKIVGRCNSGRRVWKGDQRFNVKLVSDDRSEW
jgi:ferric-chelate reductase